MKNILWGIFFVVFGLILGLNALDLININLFFDGWWTFFIILPCFIGLFGEEEKTGNLIGLLIGVLLLLCCNGMIPFDLIWKLAFPILLILIGLSFLFKNSFPKNKKRNKEDMKEYCATFSSQTLDFEKEPFEGANITAVFGVITCDLRKAEIPDEVVIECSSIFGGIDLYLPDDVNVKIKSTSIFGGVSNHKKKPEKAKKTIYIQAMCLFGGIDLK